MSEHKSIELGMGKHIELALGNSRATVRPNAEVTKLEINGRNILYPPQKLRTLSDPIDETQDPDSNVIGGSFGGWPFGSDAKRYLPTNPGIHGPAAMLTQWKIIPVLPELRATTVALAKKGGKYFEQAFGSNNYSLYRVVALTGEDDRPHGKISTTVCYEGGNGDEQGEFYPLGEHSYFQIADYSKARIAYRDAAGELRTKLVKDFEKPDKTGKIVLDNDYTNSEVEVDADHPGEIWFLPEGEEGSVVVIKRTIHVQKADGSENLVPVPCNWVLYHKEPIPQDGKGDAVAIEPIAGDWEHPVMLQKGDRITQTVDISVIPSLSQ